MIKSAVEELLRYSSPVFMLTERYAREDVTIHGCVELPIYAAEHHVARTRGFANLI